MTASALVAHPIRELVDRVLALQDDAALFGPDVSANEAFAYARDKSFAAVRVVKNKLETTPALVASVSGLNSLANGVQAVYNELTAFISNKNTGHLSNAGGHTDSAIWPFMWAFGSEGDAADGLKNAAGAVDSLASDVASSFKGLVEQRESLAATIAALTKDVAAQAEKVTELNAVLAAQKAEAGSVNATVQAQYLKEEADRTVAFKAGMEGMRGDFDTLRTGMIGNAAAALASLEKSKADASKIVGVVGNIGVTGNYQKIANDENKAAGVWRVITLVFFGFGIALATATFVEFWKEPVTTNSWSIAIRLLYAIALAAPAWYTAKEAARHRTNSDRARQTELELASIGPFIELLPQDKKDAIREEMTKRYFGKEIEVHENAPLVTGKDIASVANKAIDALSKNK